VVHRPKYLRDLDFPNEKGEQKFLVQDFAGVEWLDGRIADRMVLVPMTADLQLGETHGLRLLGPLFQLGHSMSVVDARAFLPASDVVLQ
jgi:hypothetical protein